MTEEEKLLEWCNKEFDFEAQQWRWNNIPDEILDCVITVLEQWWPHYKNEHENDFVNEFIYDRIVHSKYWKITKMCLKEEIIDEFKSLFD